MEESLNIPVLENEEMWAQRVIDEGTKDPGFTIYSYAHQTEHKKNTHSSPKHVLR